MITNGFEAAGIKEACLDARAYVTRFEKPVKYVIAK